MQWPGHCMGISRNASAWILTFAFGSIGER